MRKKNIFYARKCVEDTYSFFVLYKEKAGQSLTIISEKKKMRIPRAFVHKKSLFHNSLKFRFLKLKLERWLPLSVRVRCVNWQVVVFSHEWIIYTSSCANLRPPKI